MMNPNGFLVILALGLSSCVPVRFDNISWDERSVSPGRRHGVSISVAPRSVWTSPLNSKSKGPWCVAIGIRSPKNQEIILECLTVRDSAGMVSQVDLQYRVLLEFNPSSGDWLGSYHMDDAIVPKTVKGPLTIDLKVKAGGLPSYTITTVYDSKHFVGKETVNTLTM